MLIWVLPIDKMINHTDIYDGKMANCCQNVRGNKTKKDQNDNKKQTSKQNKKQNNNNKTGGGGGG